MLQNYQLKYSEQKVSELLDLVNNSIKKLYAASLLTPFALISAKWGQISKNYYDALKVEFGKKFRSDIFTET